MKIEQVDLQRLRPRPGNPAARSDVKAAAKWELTANVKEKGVLVPILARPLVGKAALEIVYGHRRVTASRAAGLYEIPCEIRTMTDAEAAAASAIENAQRQDVTPLEEARLYRTMQAELKWDPKTIAAQVGRSEGVVRARLRLLNLHANVLRALEDGKITAKVAGVLAGLPRPEDQAKALSEALRAVTEQDSLNELVEHMAEHMLRPIKDAPFDPADKTLPGGACALCPKNTAATPDLFGSVAVDEATCTDRACWGQKAKVNADRRVAALTAEGKKIVKIPWQEQYTGTGNVYVPAREATWILMDGKAIPDSYGEAAKLTVRSALATNAQSKKADVKAKAQEIQKAAAWAVDPAGRVRELVPEAPFASLMRKARMVRKVGSRTVAAESKEERKATEARRLRIHVHERAYWPVMHEIAQKLVKRPASQIVKLLFQLKDPSRNFYAGGDLKSKEAKAVVALVTKPAASDVGRLSALVLEEVVRGVGHLSEGFQDDDKKVAAALGVDVKAHQARARKALDEETKGSQPATSAAKTKGGR